MKKRIMSMLLVLVMIVSMLPTTVFAEQTSGAETVENTVTDDDTATVYFSASHDADYMTGESTGTVLSMLKIDVPYFDLAEYGLEDFYFISENYGDGDGDGAPGGNEFEGEQSYEGKVTMLHLLIYVTEIYQCGISPEEAGQGYLNEAGILGTEVLNVGGSAGSMVINNFWGMDMNLNYYVNHEYPLASAGWGATLDQILLEDNDIVTIGHFTSWSFFGDPASIFNYIKSGENIGPITAVQGAQVSMTAHRAGVDMMSTDNMTVHSEVTSMPEIYYTNVNNVTSGNVTEWSSLTTADAGGQFMVDTSNMEPGEYLIAMTGQYGEMYPDDICSTPGGIRLIVEEPEVEVETYPATFAGHTAQLSSFKLYTYENGVKGETDLLADVADSDTSNTQLYETELPAGDYWLEGYDSNGDCNGGIVITVEAIELNEFKVYRAYQIYANNSGWVLGTDYELTAEVTNTDKTVNRQAVMGSSNVYGTVYPSCLCLHSDTVKITYTPIGDKAETCLETFKTATMTINSSSWGQKIPETVVVTFVAPENSVISAGKFHTYYVYDFSEPIEIGDYHDLTEDTSDDETDTRIYYKFKMPKESVNAVNGPNFFYRVQNESGVTYWDFFAPATMTETTIEITEEELFIGSEEFNSETVYHNFEKNTYDRADIYLNANGQGYMDLDVGERFELNVFRNWMAIENFYNRKVALPDMEYQVIDFEGNPSDVLTITPDANNSSVADIKANKKGTAIVLVTYDAMFSTTAYVSGTGNKPNQFSAIWPENTAVLVVSVGADGTSIETNMEINRYGSTGKLDAEHDTLFYVGDEGAEYTFTPEAGCTVTVNRSVVTDTMTFEGFTNEGVTVDGNGAVTITGLTTGRHIVKIEKNGFAAYQVITAREVSYELQDAEGNELAADAEIKAGDTIYIQFTGLTNPCEKISGVYNHNATIYYVGEEGTSFRSQAGGVFGVYDFSGNPARQRIAITIPKYWSELSYTLNGAIMMNLSGSAPGAHRSTSYAKGLNANYSASTGIGSVLSALPEITLNLAETEFLMGTVSFQNQDGDTINREDLTITMTDAEGNGVVVSEDGSFKCVAGEYNYVINSTAVQYATGTLEVTEDGENLFVVSLQDAAEGAWDGVTEDEPAADENGIYQITNGAELAWFVTLSHSSGSGAVSAKLMNDIDLSWYPWNYNTSSSSKATTLDGDGHEIVNLNSGKGLFGSLGAGSNIKNLTIRGEINSTTGNSGSIVGYAYGSSSNRTVIENCVNYVTITGVGTTVGGFAGYASQTTIQNCVNHGDINTTGNVAGGIIGSTIAGCTISGCYNTGSITASSYVGGIIGNDGSYGIAVDSCYNTGSITGTGYVGGVAGQLKGATSSWSGGASSMTDCYNVGLVTGESNVGGLLGAISTAELTRGYYLAGTADSDPAASVLTEEQMKGADLNVDTFATTCNGYPALRWQTDVTFHTVPESGVVTAPTCTEKGYTTYVCSECNDEFVSEYTDPLGHDWCEDADDCDDCVYTAPTCTVKGSIVRDCRREGCSEPKTEEIDAAGHTEDEAQTVVSTFYKDCVCSVCGEAYRVWNDERLQHMDIQGNGIGNITLSDDGNYPWVYNEETERFESSNKGVNSSTSATSMTVTLNDNGSISFNYGVSSEGNYDKLTISAVIGDQTLAIANAISGSQDSSFTYELPAGTYTLNFSFSKDSSSASGSDIGWFSNLVLRAGKTEEELLAIAKEKAKAELAVYKNTEDYREEQQAELAEAIEAGNASIDAAASYEEIDAAVAMAKEAMDAVKTDAQLTQEANAVSDMIDEIGEVTLESGDAIGALRDAYDALTDSQKEEVKNVNVLENAEHTYTVLVAEDYANKAAASAEEAQKAYKDAVAAAEKADAEVAEDKEAAEAAKAEAEEAKAAAEDAMNKAEAAKLAAEAAKHAAEAAKAATDSSNEAAAKEAAKAMEEAVKAAKEAAKAADEAAKVAELAKNVAEAEAKVQQAKAEAEAAQKAAEEAAKKAEEEAAAAEKAREEAAKAEAEAKKQAEEAAKAAEEAAKAAELASAKYEALMVITSNSGNMDVELTDHQVIDYKAAIDQAMLAVMNATTKEDIAVALETMEQALEAAMNSCSASAFIDVEADGWYHDSVDFVVSHGIMTGMSDELFGPYNFLSRAQFALILYRMEDEPEVNTEKTFDDIIGDEWYADAVLWAAENEIVTGYTDGNFGPADMITREQMALMMYRYANYLEKDTTVEGNYDTYIDAESVSEFAEEAMKWVTDKGIITGKEDGTKLDPQGNTTRSEAAIIIQRFME